MISEMKMNKCKNDGISYDKCICNGFSSQAFLYMYNRYTGFFKHRLRFAILFSYKEK